MVQQKGYRVLIIVLILVVSTISCRKYYDNDEVVVIEAKNPVTGVPISGINYKIYEIKTWGGGILGANENSEFELCYEGNTDSSGYARIDYLPLYKDGKKRVAYKIIFDYSTMDVPPGDYEILRGPPNNAGSYLGYGNGTQFFDIQIVPKVSKLTQIKNLNCFDANDKIRYKIRYPHTTSGGWIGWLPDANLSSGYYYVCGDSIISINSSLPQDSVYLEIEVTRNGIVSTIRDSMLLDPSKTQDTIKIYF